MKLAVILLVVLVVVLAAATFLEAERGREFAQWYVYDSHWFIGILALLGLNILAATLVRFPWRKHQFGFLLTHAGLLILLFGSVQTFLLGIEGQVILREGETARSMLLRERSLITARRHTSSGRVSTEFSFRPGPVDWPEEEVLDFGVADDFGLKILKYYRHARKETEWVSDEKDYVGPALKLQLLGPDGHRVAEDWLNANLFGGEGVIGPTKYTLFPVSAETMQQDFLQPPTDDLGERGVLSIHYNGQMRRIRVDDQLGQKVSLGESGMEVEIVEYLANATPTLDGQFVSRGEEPDNALLELLIHLPDAETPVRQVAFAKHPLLNLDAVHGRESRVKFWYHHHAVSPVAGAAFFQTPDARLYCRPVVNGSYQPAIEVREGGQVPLGSEFSIRIAEHIPFAREEVRFVPVELAGGETESAKAAALVEVTAGATKRQLWLRRHDPQHGVQNLSTERGPVTLSFDYERRPLGFNLELEDFTRHVNPGRVGNAGFSSTVRVADAAAGVDRHHEISMNAPLEYGKFTFYQSSFQESPMGKEVSVLTAAHDPGRLLKYSGSLLICAGIFTMFYMRSYIFKAVPKLRFSRRSETGSGDTGTTGRDMQLCRPGMTFSVVSPTNGRTACAGQLSTRKNPTA
ncbi:MAG: cytochrome c biogenesis protein ResB [Pirellulaceae bacterium]